MKREYLVTCVSGLERIAENMLRREPGVAVSRAVEGALYCKSDRAPDYAYTQNAFMLLHAMSGLSNLDEAVKKLLLGGDWLDRMPFDRLQGKRFRIVTMDRDKLVSVNMDYLHLLEQVIAQHTGMIALRDRPDVELWLWRRPEGATVFGWRMQTHKPKKVEGTLRDDLCHLIVSTAKVGGRAVLCAEAQDNEGILRALKTAGCKQIVALCDKEAAARILTGRISGARALIGDMQMVSQPDASLDAVIVHLAEGKASAQEAALRGMLEEATRMLMIGGRAVLMAPKGLLEYSLQNAHKLDAIDRFDWVHGGRQTTLWVLERLVDGE